MKISKKLMALLLTLAMLAANISFAQPVFERKQYTFPDELPENSYMSNIVYINDTLYALVDMWNIYSAREGDAEFRLYAKESSKIEEDWQNQITGLYTDGARLYAYCANIGEFFEVGVNNGEIVRQNQVKFNLENHKEIYYEEDGTESIHYSSPHDTLLYNRKLYVIYDNTENSGTMLCSFDIKTGEETMYSPGNVRGFAPYKDGKLILLVQNYDSLYYSYGAEDGAAMLFVFDPATHSADEIGPLRIEETPTHFHGSILYDEYQDAIMYLDDTALMLRLSDGSAKKCAHLIRSCSLAGNCSYTKLPGGRIAVLIGDAVFIESTDSADLPSKSLNVYNAFSNNNDYAARHMLDTAIIMHEFSWFSSEQELKSALMSGENDADIFTLSSDYIDINSMIDKGYALDISGARGISQFMDSLYPYIKDACVKDGKIYAVPLHLFHRAYLQNSLLLEELNISPPKTFGDLCDIIANWYSDADRATTYDLCDHYDVKNFMWDVLFLTYTNHVFLSGEDMSYDTPTFRSMVEQLMKALENVPDPIDFEMLDPDEEYYGKPMLFGSAPLNLSSMSYAADNKQRIEMFKAHPAFANTEGNESYRRYGFFSSPDNPMVLKATEHSPEGFRADLGLVLVSSQTQDPQNALRYIEHFISGYIEQDKIILFKDYAEPKLNKYFDESLQSENKRMEALKKEIAQASGAERAELEKQLAMLEVHCQIMLEATGRYEYTQKAVDEYKSYLNDVYISTHYCNLFLYHEQISSLSESLMDGEIDLESFIREADTSLKMIGL